MFALLILVAVLALVVAAVLALLRRAWPFLVVIVLVALAVDGVTYAVARYRGEDVAGLRVTRRLFELAWRPFQLLWRWLRARVGFPYRERLRVASIGELLMLTPREFEEAIAQSLRDRGYRHVQRCGGPGDLGVDITCVDPNGERLAIQCKRYAPGNLVGSREVQLFIGMIHTEHDVDRGVYVTTSGFTAPAHDLAARHGIRLMDGYDLARTFGLDGPPLPARFSPAETQVVPDVAPSLDEAYPVAAAPADPPEPFFCPMTEDELREFEDRVTTLHLELPIEVVRPLAEDGRRGIQFGSVDEMRHAADLIEEAASRGSDNLREGTSDEGGTDYRHRAQTALIVQMLRSGGARTYELPQLPPST